MGLKSLLARLQSMDLDTLDTPQEIYGYQRKANTHASCTLDTPDTSQSDGNQMAAGHAPDPDRWCWPHSTAMNTGEIATFSAQLLRFISKGVGVINAEALADRLVIRDRESDDRRLCLECAHLQRGMRRGNWKRAGVATRANDAQLSTDLVNLLQRCDGFSNPTST